MVTAVTFCTEDKSEISFECSLLLDSRVEILQEVNTVH